MNESWLIDTNNVWNIDTNQDLWNMDNVWNIDNDNIFSITKKFIHITCSSRIDNIRRNGLEVKSKPMINYDDDEYDSKLYAFSSEAPKDFIAKVYCFVEFSCKNEKGKPVVLEILDDNNYFRKSTEQYEYYTENNIPYSKIKEIKIKTLLGYKPTAKYCDKLYEI